MRKTERIDKILSHMGFGTRSEIRKLIKQNKVYVNQQLIKDCSLQVHPVEDDIKLDGMKVLFREFVYLILNKPQGVISATEDVKERTVIDLLSDEYKKYQLFPVGRLDKDTEGLLILTNDGKLAHRLLSPKKHVQKTYYVEVQGKLDHDDVEQFQQGMTLEDGYVTMPAQLNILDAGTLSKAHVTIMEGKFHQIKRMFKQLNKSVIYLQRIRMGSLELDTSLKLSEYRELSQMELQLLKDDVK